MLFLPVFFTGEEKEKENQKSSVASLTPTKFYCMSDEHTKSKCTELLVWKGVKDSPLKLQAYEELERVLTAVIVISV